MKKTIFLLLFAALALVAGAAISAQDSEAAPAPDSKKAKHAARRAAAVAEVKQLLVDVTAETNKLNDALTAAERDSDS